MEIVEYREKILSDIKVSATSNISSLESEFIDYVSQLLIESEEFEDYTECYFESVGKHNRKIQIDGYQFDEVDGSLVLIISHFINNNEVGTITNSDIDTLFSRVEAFILHSVNGFLQENIEESLEAYGLAEKVKASLDLITKFRVYIYTDQEISKRVRALKKEPINGIPVELNVWDISRMRDLELSSFIKEDIVIDFSTFESLSKRGGLAYVQGVKSIEEDYSAYLMTIPGSILADIYLEYGSRLLEGNVRSFLSGRSKVNKQIRETIIKKPEMFFAYNNGIAATATEIEFDKNHSTIKKVRNLQIINGGQTTASIANAKIKKEGDLSKIFVPMKLSIVNFEKAEEIIPQISLSANSQNKVSDADFTSNHPFHVRMEEFSRKNLAPAVDGNQYQTVWFYERARGQYIQEQMKLTQSERNQFSLKYPKKQMIKKVDLAKYVNTMNKLPHIVSKGAQASAKYFNGEMNKEWKKSDLNFNALYFRNVVSMAILFQETERLVSNQEWYQRVKSYRANIVTYSLAILFNEIEKNSKKELDLNQIWLTQKVNEVLLRQLVITTKEVYDFITDDTRLTLNVTEWCKKEICWSRAVKHTWTILPEFISNCSVVKGYYKESREDEKKTQVVRNELDVEMQVIGKGSEFWQRLHKWGKERHLISPVEESFLKVAMNFEKTMKLPSPKQCKKILEIMDRISLEGYDVD